VATRQIPWARVLVEGVVIVASILLALALDAWWERVRERELEAAFLVQLREDLDRAGDQIRGQLQSTENAEQFTLRVLSVARGEVTPANDTLAAWLKQSTYWSDPQPTVSTAQALAESENLYVLRDPVLRSSVVSLIDRVRQLESRLQPYEQRIFGSQSLLQRWVDPTQRGVKLEVGMLGADLDAFRTGISEAVRADLLPIVRTDEFRVAFLDVFFAQENLRWYQQEMLDATVGLREAVDAELAR
jgi:hypothetical protein